MALTSDRLKSAMARLCQQPLRKWPSPLVRQWKANLMRRKNAWIVSTIKRRAHSVVAALREREAEMDFDDMVETDQRLWSDSID